MYWARAKGNTVPNGQFWVTLLLVWFYCNVSNFYILLIRKRVLYYYLMADIIVLHFPPNILEFIYKLQIIEGGRRIYNSEYDYTSYFLKNNSIFFLLFIFLGPTYSVSGIRVPQHALISGHIIRCIEFHRWYLRMKKRNVILLSYKHIHTLCSRENICGRVYYAISS